jgi:hypothetical protein
MAHPKRSLSQAERDERRRRDRERLAEATRALLSSEGWRAWLRARATFHSYSLRNTLLIAHEAGRRGLHRPMWPASRRGFSSAAASAKGERGIAILAPVRVKQRDENGDETGHTRLFFRPVHVFDVSQTEPLPGIEPAPLAPPRARWRATRTPGCSRCSRRSPASSATGSLSTSFSTSTGSAITATGASTRGGRPPGD